MIGTIPAGSATMLAATVAVTIALSAAARAEPPEPMREAAMEAVLSNPEVQSRWHAFLAAGEERTGARGGFLPEVDLNARTGYQRKRSSDDGFEDFSRNSRGADVTVTQMLYDGFATSRESSRLSEIERVRYYELLEASEETALEAMRAFADVQRQQELVDLARSNLDAHREVYDQIVDQTERGVARGADLEQAAGRLALAESNLLTERQNFHDVSARYQRVIGRAPNGERVEVVSTFSEEPIPDAVQEALAEAITMNPAMFASMRNMQAAQEQRKVARSGYHPRVDLQLRHAYENDAFEREDLWVHDSRAQLVFNWNLFRGGSDRARVRQYAEEFNEAREQQELVCRNVRQDVSVAYQNIRALNGQLEFLRQHRDSSDRVRTAYRQQFEVGQRRLLDLLDTENEYFEASRAYVNAQHDLEIAKASALSGMGRLLSYLEISREDIPSLEEMGVAAEAGRIDPEAVCPPESPGMLDVRS